MVNYYKLICILAVCAINCFVAADDPSGSESSVPYMPGLILRGLDKESPETEGFTKRALSRITKNELCRRIKAEITARKMAEDEATILREELRSVHQWIRAQAEAGALEAWNQICSMNQVEFPPFAPHGISGASSSYDRQFTTSPPAGFQEFTPLPSDTPFMSFHSATGSTASSHFPTFPDTPFTEWPRCAPGEWPAYPRTEQEGQGSRRHDEEQEAQPSRSRRHDEDQSESNEEDRRLKGGGEIESAPEYQDVAALPRSRVLEWLESAPVISDNPADDAPTSNSSSSNGPGQAASSSSAPAASSSNGLVEEVASFEENSAIERETPGKLRIWFFRNKESTSSMEIKDSIGVLLPYLELPISSNLAGHDHCIGRFYLPRKSNEDLQQNTKMFQVSLKEGAIPSVRKGQFCEWKAEFRVDGKIIDGRMPKLHRGMIVEVIFLGKGSPTKSA